MNSHQRRIRKRAIEDRRRWGRWHLGRKRIAKRQRQALRFFHGHPQFFVDFLPAEVEDRTVLVHFATLWKCMKEYRRGVDGRRTITVPNRLRRTNPGLGWFYVTPTPEQLAAHPEALDISWDGKSSGTLIIDHPSLDGTFLKIEDGKPPRRIDLDRGMSAGVLAAFDSADPVEWDQLAAAVGVTIGWRQDRFIKAMRGAFCDGSNPLRYPHALRWRETFMIPDNSDESRRTGVCSLRVEAFWDGGRRIKSVSVTWRVGDDANVKIGEARVAGEMFAQMIREIQDAPGERDGEAEIII